MKQKRYVLGLWVLLQILSVGYVQANCEWEVTGKVLIYDNLFTEQQAPNFKKKSDPYDISADPDMLKGLNGAKAIVYASTLPDGGWVKWGEDIINSQGVYKITRIPNHHDPIGCDMPRKFKVKIKLEHEEYVKVQHWATAPTPLPPFPGHPGPAEVWNEEILRTDMMNGPDIDLGTYVFNTLEDEEDVDQMINHYTFTKAATMFLAYLQITKKLKEWDLEPNQAVLMWPDVPTSKIGAPGWSDPVNKMVRISKSWFERNEYWDEEDEPIDWRMRSLQLTHELMHQWFNDHVFIAEFIGGKTCSTHDFIESRQLTLYEEFAEWAARGLNEELFNFTHEDWRKVRTGKYIFGRFANATYGNKKKDYISENELRALINTNSQHWKNLLYGSSAGCHNYLKFLVAEYMLERDFHTQLGGSESHNTANKADLSEIVPHDCSGFNTPSFTLREVFQKLKSWKEDSPGNSVPQPRGIDQLYEYLASVDADFDRVRSHYLKLGNPYYADKIFAWDICPVPQPMQQDLPVKPNKDTEVQPVKPPEVVTPVKPNVTVKPQKPLIGVDPVVPVIPPPDRQRSGKKTIKKDKKVKPGK